MSLRVVSFDELSAEAVQEERELLAQMLAEDNPAIDAKRGILFDFLMHYGGVLAAKNQEEQARLRRSLSLVETAEDDSLADDETIERLAANYRVERQPGQEAAGEVLVVVDRLAPLTMQVGTKFESQGKTFVTNVVHAVRTSNGDVLSSDDRVLTPTSDGRYSFLVPVSAASPGVDGNIKLGSLLSASPAPINFVKAQAAIDFYGGADSDSNATLAQKAIYGLSAKVLASRDNMGAVIRGQSGLVDPIADSAIGMGDVEMLRDKHSIFPTAMGGRVDWYVRTQELYDTAEVEKTAVLVSVDGSSSTWQVSFTRDEFPGLYDVRMRANATSVGFYETTLDSRGVDLTELSGSLPQHDIVSEVEAVYSRFQSLVLQFSDTDKAVGALVVGSTATYLATVRSMPRIADFQAIADSRRSRNAAADILVKAPVPCFVSISCGVQVPPGASADEITLTQVLSRAVNQLGFGSRLSNSSLLDLLHGSLPVGTTVTNLDMIGRIRKPDGTWRLSRSNELLEVPDEPAVMSTRRTVAYFLDPADVAISISIADIPEI